MKKLKSWGLISVIIYICLFIVGIGVKYIGNFLPISVDIDDIAANILTTGHGFFAGTMGYNKDFFLYNGFYLIPFFLGGMLWFLTAVILKFVSRKKDDDMERLFFAGDILLWSGFAVFGISLFLNFYKGQLIGVLIFIYMMTLFVPMIGMGLALMITAFVKKRLYTVRLKENFMYNLTIEKLRNRTSTDYKKVIPDYVTKEDVKIRAFK